MVRQPKRPRYRSTPKIGRHFLIVAARGASGMVVLSYRYVLKPIENGIHAGADLVVPH